MSDKTTSNDKPTAAASDARDWGKTLYLPETPFPMRAGLPQMEPKLIERWAKIDLYSKLRAQSKGKTRFTLHDGPPYANGNIHIGHALNKILKDLVTRSQQMLGFDSNYVPGWDCHGLPIEWKIEEEYIKSGKAKPNLKDPVAMKAFRAECRAFAAHWMKVQEEEFKRLGVEGDWKNPYATMTFPAEAQIAREIMKFKDTEQLYRGSKPVMWSVVEKTALAEAEVEYHDYQSDAVFVKFPVVSAFGGKSGDRPGDPFLKGWNEFNKLIADHKISVVIWTTTPWTLPGNRAISFNSKVEYGLYEVTAAPENNWAKVGEVYILADKLADGLMKAAKVEAYEPRGKLSADFVGSITCAHPLRGHFPLSPSSGGEGRGEGRQQAQASAPHPASGHLLPARGEKAEGAYAFDVPLLDGDHVTDDAGTGFVHTAPGHGREDFDIWTAVETTQKLRARNIDTAIPYTVDENGALTTEAPGFTGERVITDKGEKGKANDAVIKALADAGMMVARSRLKHQYPHSWRSKKPVIFRNTPQWFIHMDKEIPYLEEQSKKLAAKAGQKGHNEPIAKTLREVSLRSIRETEWVPKSGENRITGMITAKPDWVVSRQRAWGVPITVFVKKGTHEILRDKKVDDRIYDAIYKEGADAWFTDTDGARFLKPDYNPADYEKINDVLDVWFDSGSTHTYVLEDKVHFPGLYGFKRKIDGGQDRVMYLEGTDQHRGWFHSSLIESSGTRGHAPYDVVLTHGFCLDEKGAKMSKSVGNVVAPQDVIKNSGADILRLWVASSDYSDDLQIGPGILKNFAEQYRKLRNTIRWMLGTLSHYDAKQVVAYKDMPALERYMLHHLATLDGEIKKAYAEYDYKKVVSTLAQFMNTELSAFYFDIRKDALYCEAPSSLKRRAALQCVEHIFRCVTVWLAPILTFTAEEAWLARYPSEAGSVHLELFPSLPKEWHREMLDGYWTAIRNIRSAVTATLELERAAKRIGSSLEAAPIVYLNQNFATAVLKDTKTLTGLDLAEICITSDLTIIEGPPPEGAYGAGTTIAVVPNLAEGKKCARSWRITKDVGSDPAYPDLSARDAAAMHEIDKR
ncbi:MAG: isoleucine--tRNA ligase [Hyphomicrobiaceae bacterium]